LNPRGHVLKESCLKSFNRGHPKEATSHAKSSANIDMSSRKIDFSPQSRPGPIHSREEPAVSFRANESSPLVLFSAFGAPVLDVVRPYPSEVRIFFPER
jgi:hypothetical protein